MPSIPFVFTGDGLSGGGSGSTTVTITGDTGTTTFNLPDEIYFIGAGGASVDVTGDTVTITASGGGGGSLNSLSDVTITSISDREFLVYDNASSKWVNQTYSELNLAVLNQNNTFTENIIINGNLTVNGTVTQINSTEVNIGDNVIVLNDGETGTPTQDSGIEIERGTSTNAKLIWNETTDKWQAGLDGSLYNIILSTDIGTMALEDATDYSPTSAYSTVAFSGSYNDLYNLPDLSGYFLTTNFSSTFDSNLAAKSTTNLSEGTNLYYTDTRFDTRLGTKTTDNLSEGSTNKYYTDEKVDDRVAALIQNGTGITWSYNDSLNTLTPTVTITQYTDEMAQDAVGGILTSGTYVNATYNDGANTITVDLSTTGTPDGTKFLRDDNTWATPSGGGMSDPTTTDGDIIIRASGATTRLGIGSTNQVLSVKSGLPSWEDATYADFPRYVYEDTYAAAYIDFVGWSALSGTNYVRLSAGMLTYNTTLYLPSSSIMDGSTLLSGATTIADVYVQSRKLPVSFSSGSYITDTILQSISLGTVTQPFSRRAGGHYGTIGCQGIDVAVPGIAPVSNRTYVFPVFLPHGVSGLKFGVETAQASGGSLYFNIYSINLYRTSGITPASDALLSSVDASSEITSTGIKSISFSGFDSTFSEGYYLLSMRAEGITNLVLSTSKYTDTSETRRFFGIGNDPATDQPCYGWYYDSTSADETLTYTAATGEITVPSGITFYSLT